MLDTWRNKRELHIDCLHHSLPYCKVCADWSRAIDCSGPILTYCGDAGKFVQTKVSSQTMRLYKHALESIFAQIFFLVGSKNEKRLVAVFYFLHMTLEPNLVQVAGENVLVGCRHVIDKRKRALFVQSIARDVLAGADAR